MELSDIDGKTKGVKKKNGDTVLKPYPRLN